MLVAMVGLGSAGCGSLDQGELALRFQDEDPAVRMGAALEAGRTRDAKSVPYLVDRLGDSESDVRFAAIMALEKITGESVGFNHEIWLHHFEYEGKDAYPLLEEWIETKAASHWADYHPAFTDTQMSPAAIELYKLTGLMPIGDTPRGGGWWLHQDLATKRRWYGELGGFDSEIGWQQYLDACWGRVEQIHKAANDPSTTLTEVFPPKHTGEQHFPLIDALWNDNEVTLQVNVPNNGAIQGIPDDVVVELPAVCSHRGIQPLQVGRLPRSLMLTQLYPRLLHAEQLIAMALEPDERVLLRMILDDHRTKSWDRAVEFLEAIKARPEFAEVAAEMARPKHPFRRSC
jgi:alpha-galactosidase